MEQNVSYLLIFPFMRFNGINFLFTRETLIPLKKISWRKNAPKNLYIVTYICVQKSSKTRANYQSEQQFAKKSIVLVERRIKRGEKRE